MDSTLECLAAWMPRQRWYGAKGRIPTLRLVSSWDFPTAEPDVTVRTLLVADDSSAPPVLYQVPVVARATASVDPTNPAIIGSPTPGTVLVDGTADAAYTAALLHLITSAAPARGAQEQPVGMPAVAAPVTADINIAHVLTGEQSNTSIIYTPTGDGSPVICKVFRQVHPGLNPDIELQTALAAAGSPWVPRAVGHLEGRWTDISSPATLVSGSLAFAQEFLPGVEDAWRVALKAAHVDEDFSDRARALGIATAEVHRDLARLFPTRATLPSDREATAATWRRRLTIAIAEIPALTAHKEAIEACYERALAADWPLLQRVHGDYHLGQVVLVPDRGWVLLDFEGEPMRPMAERIRPDLALRDIAGMLRSFDYVAGSIRLEQPKRSPESATTWTHTARIAFLSGYAERSGVALNAVRALLDALELDKAVYETIYETRNRPTWLPIPVGAIERLLDRSSPAA